MRTLISFLGTFVLLFGVSPAAENQKAQAVLTVTVNQEKSVVLTWTASTTPGITSYQIERSEVSGGSYSEVGTTDGSTLRFQDITVMPHTTYYYVAIAVTQDGNSPFSNQSAAIIP
jgi:hypothetical protein